MKKIIITGILLVLFLLPSVSVIAQDGENECPDMEAAKEALTDALDALDAEDVDTALGAIAAASNALDCVPSTPLEACESDQAKCVNITSIVINGQKLSPDKNGIFGPLVVTSGTEVRVDSLTYSLNNENAETIGEKHGRLSYAYAYAFPIIKGVSREDIAQASPSVNPIAATHGRLNLGKGPSWLITASDGWERLVVMIEHGTSQPELKVELPIGRVDITIIIE